jgi:hypothetical protein
MSLDQDQFPVEEEVTREIVRVLRMGATFQAALHGLHARLELPAVLDEQERMRLATAYDGTAATLRARAAKEPDGSPARVELERRAATYEARSRVKRGGQRMPRNLRTPRERLEAVALLRDALVQVLALAGEVDAADLEFFEAALVDNRGVRPPTAGSAGEQLGFVQSILRGVLARLGALVDDAGDVHLLPFAMSITETADGVLTGVVAGAAGAQPRVSFSGAAAPAPAGPLAETSPGETP